MRRMKRRRARASASIANLGYGFDVFAMCVGIASDEVELSLGVPRTTLVVERDEAQPVPHTPAKNTAGVALQSLMRAHKIRVPVRIRLVKQVPSGGLGSSA